METNFTGPGSTGNPSRGADIGSDSPSLPAVGAPFGAALDDTGRAALALSKANAYLQLALEPTANEIAIRERMRDWLPPRIVDAHTHSNLQEHVVGLDPLIFAHPMSTFPSFSLEQGAALQDTLYPEREVTCLRFAHAFRGIDHRAANSYLLDNTPPQDRVALYGIPSDIEYTNALLAHPGVAALKMYAAFFNPRSTHIYQFFKPEILEEAQSRSIPIILHLPKKLTESFEDLHRMLTDFPRLKVVLAHLGVMEQVEPGLASAYSELRKNTNVYMDTAVSLTPHHGVLKSCLDNFGWERVIFGSDEPLNLIRANLVWHNELGSRWAVPSTYHWTDPRMLQPGLAELAVDAILVHWQVLEGAREAIQSLDSAIQPTAKRAIFFDTAKELFGF